MSTPATTTATVSSRWRASAALIVGALAFSWLAVIAGQWQYGRHVDRSAAIVLYDSNSALAPTSVGSVALSQGGSFAQATEWRVLTAQGTFDADSLTLLRNRPVSGTNADQFLAWFDTSDGTSILVNIGWLPRSPASLASVSTPEGVQTIVFTVRAPEPDDGKRSDSATRIIPAQMPAPGGSPMAGYGMLDACAELSTVCDGDALPPSTPLPKLSKGPHFAYAVQWYLFAAAAPFGALALVRRETPPVAKSSPNRAPKRQRGLSDEDVEDALS